MRIYVINALPPSAWTKCPICDGNGEYVLLVNSEHETVICDNCSEGTIKTELVLIGTTSNS